MPARPPRAIASRLAPMVKGEVAALALDSDPRPLPPLTFTDGDGKPVTLADFHGHDILLNLWATWCVPCRMEMPSLDRLQGARGNAGFFRRRGQYRHRPARPAEGLS